MCVGCGGKSLRSCVVFSSVQFAMPAGGSSSNGASRGVGRGSETPIPTGCCSSFFEYETPKVVTVQNVPLGILRLLLQTAVIAFVVIYQLWYARGYQEFAEVEASVTTKVKGFSMSRLTEAAKLRVPADRIAMYERVWDESDYVIPPSENNAFFVMTNVILTPNQTRSTCPEDPGELPELVCGYRNETSGQVDINQQVCAKGQVNIKSHGETTGNCIESDRKDNVFVCEIDSWCPVEIDQLPLDKAEGPLIPGAEDYTVFIKNSISFTRFGKDYHKNNMPQGICIYEPNDPETHHCPIFRLGEIIHLAGGNFKKLSVKGGVIGVYITWNCDLDWSFDDYCLPTYSFRILDTYGWNFRHAYYHEENRRTLIKAYGLKFLVVVDGRASKFDLKNTVIVLVTGLGLLGLSTMFCDFILLNYSTDRRRVKEKKYETVGTTSQMLAASLRIMGASSVSLQPFRNPIRSGSVMSSMTKKSPPSTTTTPNTANTATGTTESTSNNIITSSNGGQKINNTDNDNDIKQVLDQQQHPVVSEVSTTTVLLQPENCCRVRTANHVTYSIDTKPPHLVRGSPL